MSDITPEMWIANGIASKQAPQPDPVVELEAVVADLAAAQATIAELRGLLDAAKELLRHDGSCAWLRGLGRCTCGLVDVADRIDAALEVGGGA